MISTIGHRVLNAHRFFTDTELWAVLGGTNAWPDDNNPPLPDTSTGSINTIIGAKKATASMVKRDDVNGTEAFLMDGVITRWTIIPDLSQAISEEARFVLVRVTITGDEGGKIPLSDFREIGIYSNLIRAGGVPEGQEVLSVSDVANFGQLEFIKYRMPVTRDLNSAYTFATVIEF